MHRLCFLLLLMSVSVLSADAQSLWTRPYKGNQIALEVLKPSLETGAAEERSPLTSTTFVSGTFLLSERAAIVLDLPVAHYNSTIQAPDDEGLTGATAVQPPSVDLPPGPATVRQTELGNPYVGLALGPATVPFLLEAGVRVPLAASHDVAGALGQLADYDRSEAFAANQFSAQMLLNYRLGITRKLSVRLRGGGLTTVDTQEKDNHLFGRYSAQAWYEGDRLILGTGFTGRALLTKGGTVSHRSVHHLGGTFMAHFESVQPGLLLRVPLDSTLSDTVNLIWGVTLSVSL